MHGTGAQIRYMVTVALIVALGGFLMGFDASVISGVASLIRPEFDLNSQELGWLVGSLTLTSSLAMLASGPLSDRLGRRPVLRIAAVLFAVSALASAAAPDFGSLVAARMLGGFGVGAALIVAPMYIAEIAPDRIRGRMVSFNQLNIVIGLSAAYFSNLLILKLGGSELGWAQALNFGDWNWRWMLGVEAIPAVIYFLALFAVPESPRWLVRHGRGDEALRIMERVSNPEQARASLAAVRDALRAEAGSRNARFRELLHPALRTVLTIGLVVAILQQIVGINAVFFYAPMIFEQSGIGTDAAFTQAVVVGAVNVVFTVLAILTIDRLGRRPLLIFGATGIAVCMLLLSYGFGSATYSLSGSATASLPDTLDRGALAPLEGELYDNDVAFREAVVEALGAAAYQEHRSALVGAAMATNTALHSLSDAAVESLPDTLDKGALARLVGDVYDDEAAFRAAVVEVLGAAAYEEQRSALVGAAIDVNPVLILAGILGFVASFAVSLGPVMWVLLSELFPNRVRGLAIAFVGLVNSGVSFGVQLVFPWQLENLGSSPTFLIFAVFAVIGLALVVRLVPETRGRNLEEMHAELAKA